MAGQSPTSQPFPDEAIALAHGIATRHVRSDRFASLVWAVIFGVGFLVFLGLCVGGSFTGHDAVIGEVVLGVLIAFLLYATLHGLVQETRTLASLEAPPRQLRLTSDRLRRSSSDRRVGLHEGSSVIGTARISDAAADPAVGPIQVFVFGAVAPGERVVCVDPRHSLVATCKLERDRG
jgi:hypothetical protein